MLEVSVGGHVYSPVYACARPNVICVCVCVCDKRWSWSCNLMTQPLMCVNAVSPILQSCTRFMRAECTLWFTAAALFPGLVYMCSTGVVSIVPSQITGFQLFHKFKSRPKRVSSLTFNDNANIWMLRRYNAGLNNKDCSGDVKCS